MWHWSKERRRIEEYLKHLDDRRQADREVGQRQQADEGVEHPEGGEPLSNSMTTGSAAKVTRFLRRGLGGVEAGGVIGAAHGGDAA